MSVEIDEIRRKPYDKTTMGEAIVLYLASVGSDVAKEEALNRIGYLRSKGKGKKLGLNPRDSLANVNNIN